MSMKITKLINSGMRALAGAYSQQEYVRPNRDGFKQDNAALRGDVCAVGKDMSVVITKYGEQYKYSNKKS